MKWKNVAAFGLAAVLTVTMAGCGKETGKSDNQKGSEKAEASDKLVINYISSRNDSDGTIKTIKKLADDYKKEHKGFEFNVESIPDRETYLQKIKILASI